MKSSINKKKIMIGFLSKTIKGPIPLITRVYLEELKDQYEFIPFIMERKMGKTRLASFNLLNFFYLISHYIKWCITIIKERPDIVHFPITSFWNMEKSLLFLSTAKCLGVKHTIGHLHGGAFIDFWLQTSNLRRRLALRQFLKLDILIVLSESWRKNVLQYININDHKVKILHNLIDQDFESHFISYQRNYNRKDKVVLLGFNLMDSKKGLFDLLEAISLIKDRSKFELVIIGDEREPGICLKAMKIINEKRLTNVEIRKGVWDAGKKEWFEKADILLLPSYIENFPVVVIEAACAGLPVIASEIGALPDIFTNDYDILYLKPGDISNLSKLIGRLIMSHTERRYFGKNIKKTFERELLGKEIIKQLDCIYESVLN